MKKKLYKKITDLPINRNSALNMCEFKYNRSFYIRVKSCSNVSIIEGSYIRVKSCSSVSLL